jgi:hypothetical protein
MDETKHSDQAYQTPDPDPMTVPAQVALSRCGLAPHVPALLSYLGAQHPDALPDDLTETVDLVALLGEPAPLPVAAVTVVDTGSF